MDVENGRGADTHGPAVFQQTGPESRQPPVRLLGTSPRDGLVSSFRHLLCCLGKCQGVCVVGQGVPGDALVRDLLGLLVDLVSQQRVSVGFGGSRLPVWGQAAGGEQVAAGDRELVVDGRPAVASGNTAGEVAVVAGVLDGASSPVVAAGKKKRS